MYACNCGQTFAEPLARVLHSDGCKVMKLEREIVDLTQKLDSANAALAELEKARIGWIHHVCGPDILKALWKHREGGRPCSHTVKEYGPNVSGPGDTWTAPGVGYVGYSYCTCCGERRQ